MRFSIIIPCLNRHQDLRQAVRSCLDQDYGDFEIIIVDDGSNPPLQESLSDLIDARIRYHRNVANEGAAACRNIGIGIATGEYISFLDSDDIYFRNRLLVLDEFIRHKKGQPDLIFHIQRRILGGKDGGLCIPWRMPRPGERLDEYVLINGNYVQTNSFIIRKYLAAKIQFDSSCVAYEDTIFLIACWLECKNYAACGDVLSIYHDDRRTGRLSKQRNSSRLLPLLRFAKERCSSRAYIGILAFAAAEISFWRSPATVLWRIWRGRRIGVAWSRCAVYLARSMFGVERVEGLIYSMRRNVANAVPRR